MPDQLAGPEREQQPKAEVSKPRTQPSPKLQDFTNIARGGKAYRFYQGIPWGQLWGEFLDVAQDGKLRYPTVWSLARAKGRTDWERKLIYEIVGPEPKLLPGQKRRAPWLGDWEHRRAMGVYQHADSATRRRMRRALEERAQSMDRIRRAAALMTIQEVSRWQRAAEQLDLAFAGRPYLPNEPPHSPRNRARSREYFRMHMEAQQNMWSSLLPFIELSRSEPADEGGWLRIMQAFKNK
jgi:hypothetical protein